MKKKNIVFSVLAILFLLSAFSGISNSNITGGLGCLVLAALFAFLAYRSFKQDVAAPASPKPAPPPEQTFDFGASQPLSGSDAVSVDDYACEYLNITLSGVSYRNDDGTDRQLILQKIHFHTVPFDEYIEVSIRESSYNNEPAYPVFANGLQIGYIPKSQIAYVHENFDRIVEVSRIKVYGGGRDKSGNVKSYGASISLKLRTS